MLSMTACANGRVTETACDWLKPIMVSQHDIEVMTAETKRQILDYNRSWKAACASVVDP